MIRYREILRLYSQGISKTAIAQSCECSRNTVAKVVQRAEEVGITWPLAYFGNIRTPISVVSGQHNGNIRTL